MWVFPKRFLNESQRVFMNIIASSSKRLVDYSACGEPYSRCTTRSEREVLRRKLSPVTTCGVKASSGASLEPA